MHDDCETVMCDGVRFVGDYDEVVVDDVDVDC